MLKYKKVNSNRLDVGLENVSECLYVWTISSRVKEIIVE